jgi:oligoendopeptidase F
MARRERLNSEMEPGELIDIMRAYEHLVEQMYTFSAYGSLWFSADTQSSAALTFRNRMQQTLTNIQNRTLFFDLWWKGLDDDEAAALLPSATQFPDYRFYLEDLRRTKPYTLDEKSEQIINIKDANGMDAVMTLFSMLTSRLEFTLEVDGETKTLTRDALMGYVHSPRPELRAAAYQELYRVYQKEANILAQVYSNRVRDWHGEQVELRGYKSPIAVRNVANDIPDEAVETLLEVCRRNAPLFQRYFKLKAGWLGMDKLRRYDIYAPLTESDREIPYDEAVRMVLETFAGFDRHVAEQAERVFADNHIDSEVRKGKRGGAFCATVLPSQTPWVLMNYTGKVRDVATLAHELGHAIHSMMAEHHPVLTQHSTLPLAETASVFSEMLLTDRLLAEEQDPLVRRDILASSVDDMYATVMRQAFFVIFERAAHAAILDNKSPDELSAMYMENLAEQFGDSVEIAPEFQYEWEGIPHIFNTPFYCYAYSFGQLLVLALYRRYQQEGEAFKPGYLRMLAHGGAARPAQILEEAGIDMTDPAFWQGGFDVIRDMIDQLEAIKL